MLRDILEAGGVRVVTSARVTGFDVEEDGVRVETCGPDGAAGPTLTGGLVLMAVGVAPETGFVEGVVRTPDGGMRRASGARADAASAPARRAPVEGTDAA